MLGCGVQRELGGHPKLPVMPPLLPKRGGGWGWFSEGVLLPDMSWGSEFHPCLLCPRPVLVHPTAPWLPVSSPGLLHSRWRCLMPVCCTEFNQDPTAHVTSFFFFPLPKATTPHLLPPSLCSAGPGSLPCQQQAVGAVLLAQLPALCFCRPPGRGAGKGKALPFS